jgi:hypothetical protein
MSTEYDWRHNRSPLDHAHTPYDELPFFGDRKINDTSNSEVANLLINAGVPGASHANGRQDNLAAWDKFHENLRKEAADKAVADFLAGKSA